MQLERTRAVLADGIERGDHIGAQLAVSCASGATEFSLGEAAAGVPMTDDTLMLWFSMSKAVCAVATAQLWERGLLRLDEPVATYLPEFGAAGKGAVTVRHLLTHTAGIPWADGILEAWPWRETVAENRARISGAALEPGWEPGRRAGYHAASGMTVLGAVVERLDGRTYDAYVRAEIFEPLGMTDCWVGMPPERYAAYGDRIGVMHATATGSAQPLRGIDSLEATVKPIPGANGRGPMRQMRAFYEMLRDEGRGPGSHVLLRPQTVAAITARHRVGMLDETFGITIDWGLGFTIDNYAMGRHCSPRTFGHGGSQSSVAFCDPEAGVVCALVCNGRPGPERHHPRMDAIATALYEDLGLARGEGRTKPYPASGF
jgi:CubicO group peptidase (beta-lactamase class C family)